MSVTTTDNARVTAVRHLLADYDLHHSQPPEGEEQPAPEPNGQTSSATTTSNPVDWETEWRRVPSYRPVQNQLDDQRDVYNNEIEHNFIRVMFGGVWMMATASRLWRSTGGKLNDSFFQYKIGGEW